MTAIRISKPKLSPKRRAELKAKAKALSITMKKPYRAYHEIQKKIDKSWKKLCINMKSRSLRAIEKSKNDLLLLLGECHYMVGECKRCLNAKSR